MEQYLQPLQKMWTGIQGKYQTILNAWQISSRINDMWYRMKILLNFFIFQHPWSSFKWWRFCDPSSVGNRPKTTKNSTPEASLRHASKLQDQGSHQSNTSRKKNRLFCYTCISLQRWRVTDASNQRSVCPYHPRTSETSIWGSNFWHHQSKPELLVYYNLMVRIMIKHI